MSKTGNLYLLVGDPFLVQEKEKALLAGIEKKFSAPLDRKACRLSDTPLEGVLIEARSLPFFCAGQIFILKEAQALTSEALGPLAAYLSHPENSTFLIFESQSLERDHPLAKLVSERGQIFWLEEREKRQETGRFIREKLSRFHKTIAPRALARLEEQMGQAPLLVNSVLDQLIVYAAGEKEITERMVEAFEENWQKTDVFEFLRFLSEQKTGPALVRLKQMFREGEELVPLLGMLHWKLRQLWKARMLLDAGEPEGAILKRCRVWPKQAPFFIKELKGFSRKRLERALEGLFRLDWKIKTGQAEAEAGLETWLVNTTS